MPDMTVLPAYIDSPEEMLNLLHTFISFFFLLGIFSFIVLIAVIVTLILLLKSKAREKETGKYADVRYAGFRSWSGGLPGQQSPFPWVLASG